MWHHVQNELMDRVRHFGDLAMRCYSQPLQELVGFSHDDVLSYLGEISKAHPYS